MAASMIVLYMGWFHLAHLTPHVPYFFNPDSDSHLTAWLSVKMGEWPDLTRRGPAVSMILGALNLFFENPYPVFILIQVIFSVAVVVALFFTLRRVGVVAQVLFFVFAPTILLDSNVFLYHYFVLPESLFNSLIVVYISILVILLKERKYQYIYWACFVSIAMFLLKHVGLYYMLFTGLLALVLLLLKLLRWKNSATAIATLAVPVLFLIVYNGSTNDLWRFGFYNKAAYGASYFHLLTGKDSTNCTPAYIDDVLSGLSAESRDIILNPVSMSHSDLNAYHVALVRHYRPFGVVAKKFDLSESVATNICEGSCENAPILFQKFHHVVECVREAVQQNPEIYWRGVGVENWFGIVGYYQHFRFKNVFEFIAWQANRGNQAYVVQMENAAPEIVDMIEEKKDTFWTKPSAVPDCKALPLEFFCGIADFYSKKVSFLIKQNQKYYYVYLIICVLLAPLALFHVIRGGVPGNRELLVVLGGLYIGYILALSLTTVILSRYMGAVTVIPFMCFCLIVNEVCGLLKRYFSSKSFTGFRQTQS